MEKVQALDVTQYKTTSKSAVEAALDICQELAWDPTEVVQASLLDLLVMRLSSHPSTEIESLREDSKSLQVVETQHYVRGSSVQDIVKHAISSLGDINAVDLISTSKLKARLASLHAAFPGAHFNHAIAVKANPIRSVLRIVQEMGFGAECASFAEVHHALSLNFAPRSVVYDSPCKTYDELKTALQLGCYINLDNEDEIDKVARVFIDLYGPSGVPADRLLHDRQIGLRINPVVGGGSIASTSTATSSSKFGLPWTPDTQATLVALFHAHPWLQGVHVHVGSQGCALDLLVAGAKRAVEFAALVNTHVGRDQVRVVDIGGGLPTVYDGVSDLTYEAYAVQLRAHVPAVFSSALSVVTEFGRSVFVKAGITLTKVESVKRWDGQNIAVVHVGANQFLRTAYLPHQWPHVFSVFDATGALKSGPLVRQDIAGPLCFSGDFLAKQVLLPQILAGDYIVIHDTGGYTVSMYSKYNSRPSTAIYGYDDQLGLTPFKEQETVDQVLAFWGP